MAVSPHTQIRALLEELPALEDILSWYDVRLSPQELDMTLEQLCSTRGLDLDDILCDIDLSEDEDPDDDDSDFDDDYDDDDDES